MIERFQGVMTASKAWWRGRAPREQRVLGVGALFLLPTLLIFAVWLPVNEQIRKREAQALALEKQVLELRGLQTAMKAQNKLAPNEVQALSFDLPARLEVELLALHPDLKGAIRANGAGIELQVDAGIFDVLLPWLDELSQREGLFPTEVQFTAGPTAGWVTGLVRLNTGGVQ